MQWSITIPIMPQAKQSFRYASVNNKIIRYQPKGKTNYVGAIKTYAMSKRPERLLEGALVLSVTFVFPFISKHGKRLREQVINNEKRLVKTTKPDLDNLLKPIKDALKGVVYADDNQISAYYKIDKIYGESGKIEINVREIGE